MTPLRDRKPLRLKTYDYNQAGTYFITLCIQHRECLLGHIENGIIHLSEYGKIVHQIWQALPIHFSHLTLDAAVIMPNHFHGILILERSQPSTGDRTQQPFYKQQTQLGKIIAYFKYQTTKLINQHRDLAGVKLWQRNYYDHIVRDQESLQRLRQYIFENSFAWSIDQLHPNNPSKW